MPKLFGKDNPSFKHGMSDTSTFKVWAGMINRCTNSKTPAWVNYGGRGISVCSRWTAFRKFLADMGVRPEGLSLDRINNDGNYEPANCRWATRTQQNKNSRHNVYIEHNGQRKLISEWADELGIQRPTLVIRFQKGWIAPDLFRKPTFKSRRYDKAIAC